MWHHCPLPPQPQPGSVHSPVEQLASRWEQRRSSWSRWLRAICCTIAYWPLPLAGCGPVPHRRSTRPIASPASAPRAIKAQTHNLHPLLPTSGWVIRGWREGIERRRNTEIAEQLEGQPGRAMMDAGGAPAAA